MVLFFHSSCRLRHATLCFLPPGLANAAHPAVLPISSQKSLSILVLVFQPHHWSMPLLRHPNFPLTVLSTWCPRCAFHALDEATVPDCLIILRSNRPCCVSVVPTMCSSLSVALPSQIPGMNRESNLLRSVSSSRTSASTADPSGGNLARVIFVMSSLEWCFAVLSNREACLQECCVSNHPTRDVVCRAQSGVCFVFNHLLHGSDHGFNTLLCSFNVRV